MLNLSCLSRSPGKEPAPTNFALTGWRRRSLLLLTGVVWGSTFLLTGSVVQPLLGVLCGVLLYILWRLTPQCSAKEIVLTFIGGHLIGFAWMIPMLGRYLEWPTLLSVVALGCFGAYGSLQFLAVLKLAAFYDKGLCRRLQLALPLVWACSEVLFPKPFDWYLSYSHTDNLWLRQTADIAGPSFSSFLLMWFSVSATECLHACVRQRTRSALHFGGVAALVVLFVWFYGARSARTWHDAQPDHLHIVSIDQSTRPARELHEDAARAVATRYGALFEEAVTHNTTSTMPDLVILPESAILKPVLPNPTDVDQLLSDAGLDMPFALLFGAEIAQEGTETRAAVNGSVLRQRSTGTLSVYEKQLGFPLAEQSVVESFFSNSSRTVISDTSYTFQLPQSSKMLPVALTPLICFESTLPRYTASVVNTQSPQLIVELSNHNWFQGTSTAAQHGFLARWRSVETRTPLLRIINSGGLLAYDKRGNALSVDTTPRLGGTVSRLTIPLSAPSATLATRLQSSHWFEGVLVGILLILAILVRCEAGLVGKILLLFVAFLYPIGKLTESQTLMGLGLMSGASPNPFVFNRYEGIDYWSLDSELEVLTTSARRIRVPLSKEKYSLLPGPHHYHVAYLLPFAFGMTYPREIWEPPLLYGFCGQRSNNHQPELATIFGITEPIASVLITSSERTPPFRSWSNRVVCRREAT